MAAPGRTALLDLVIQLHVEGVLSERASRHGGGMDRVAMRRLADAASAGRPTSRCETCYVAARLVSRNSALVRTSLPEPIRIQS